MVRCVIYIKLLWKTYLLTRKTLLTKYYRLKDMREGDSFGPPSPFTPYIFHSHSVMIIDKSVKFVVAVSKDDMATSTLKKIPLTVWVHHDN